MTVYECKHSESTCIYTAIWGKVIGLKEYVVIENMKFCFVHHIKYNAEQKIYNFLKQILSRKPSLDNDIVQKMVAKVTELKLNTEKATYVQVPQNATCSYF